MRIVARTVFICLIVGGWSAPVTLLQAKVDVTKKKIYKVIRPSEQSVQIIKKYQEKRYKGTEIKTEAKQLDKARLANSAVTNPERAIGGKEDKLPVEEIKLSEKEYHAAVIAAAEKAKGSKNFEKDYQEALVIELAKRAAKAENASKAKKATKGDINEFSKSKRTTAELIPVESAGGD